MRCATSRRAGGRPGGSGYVPLWQGIALYHLGVLVRRAREPRPVPGRHPRSRSHAAGAAPPRTLPRLARGPAAAEAGAREAARRLAGGPNRSYAKVALGTLLARRGSWAELARAHRGGPRPTPIRGATASRCSDRKRCGRRGGGTRRPPWRASWSLRATTTSRCPAYQRLFAAAELGGDLPTMQSLTQAAEVRFTTSPPVLAELWTRTGAPATGGATGSSRSTSSPGCGACATARRSARSRCSTSPRRGSTAATRPARGGCSRRSSRRAAEHRRRAHAPRRRGAPDGRLRRRGGSGTRSTSMRGPGSERRAEAGYLLAYCRYRQGRYDEAAAAASRFAGQAGPFARDFGRLRIALLKRGGPDGGGARRDGRPGRRRPSRHEGPARADEAAVPARPAGRAARRSGRAVRARHPISPRRTRTPSCSPPTCGASAR